MNLTILGSLLILGAYLHATLLYPPVYNQVQAWLVQTGLLDAPAADENDPQTPPRQLGSRTRIITVSIIALAVGLWMVFLGG